METLYTDILINLEPYKDKAFYFPLINDEIDKLEKRIGQRFPAYFRQFLSIFGVRQDFVSELIMREQDFVDEYKYLPKSLRQDFVPIGGSSAGGDTWLVKAKSEEQNIYEMVHEGYSELTMLDFSFLDLVDKNLAELIESYDKKLLNKDKYWSVQFATTTTKETLLLKTIDAQQTKGWADAEISSADVYTYDTEIEIASKKIKLSRQEYKDWKKPTYYFNWREPAYQMGADSFIRILDKKLTKAFKGYKLIDYGILPLLDDD